MAQYNLNRNYTLKSITVGDTAECYFDSVSNEGTVTVTSGSLVAEKTTLNTNWDWLRGTRGVSSGKWYWEITVDTMLARYLMVGITAYVNTSTTYVGANSQGWGYYAYNGNKWHNSSTAWGSIYNAVATIGIALDMDNHNLYITSGDGNWQQSQDPSNDLNPFANDLLTGTKMYPSVDLYHVGDKVTANFGATSFQYSVPSGYTAIHYSTFSPDAGNKALLWSEIDLLIDGNTTSDGVTLTTSDVLHMETDLTDRLKVDDIRLYLDSPSASGTVLNNIDFYYKDDPEDVYVAVSKYISIDGYYYGEIPSPSAPSMIKTTISGIEATVYEYVIFNDEYLVNYGDEGQLYRKYLERATIGQSGDPTALEIFNNNPDTNDPPVSSYTCVDFSDQPGDYYLKLANSENGTYLGLDDGGIIEDDAIGSSMKWSYGLFYNTEVSGTSVVLSSSAFDSYINDVPLVDSNAYGWMCMPNCWEYSRSENRIFCMGSDDGPLLKLWEYDVTTNTFEFLSLINPSGPTDHQYHSSMANIDDKIYVCINQNAKFGYHDLNGVVNNWTGLADIPWSWSSTKDRIAIVGDQERYIYALGIDSSEGWVPAPETKFLRYDTISGTTWSGMDNTVRGVYSGTDWGVVFSMAYDHDRNCIYLLSGDFSQPATTATDWIQRYDIATDTWDNTYFRLADSFTVGQRHKAPIAYNNDCIYVFLSGVGTVLYKVNLTTFSVEVADNNFVSGNTNYIRFILATDSYFESEGTTIYAANPITGTKRLYVSNLYTNDGTYKSPIFRLDDQYMASYFVMDYTCGNRENISWDDDYRNGTMYLRSSDTDPIAIDEYYWPYEQSSYIRIQKTLIYTDSSDDTFISLAIGNGWHWASIAVSPVAGTIAVSRDYTYGDALQSQLLLYDRNGTQTYTSLDNSDFTRSFHEMGFDSEGGVWAHTTNDNGHLLHFDSALNETCDSTASATSYITMTVSLGSTKCWYITSTSLYLITDGGVIDQRFNVSTPQLMCSTEDGGCWVVSSNTTVYRYSSDGLVKSIALSRPATSITRNFDNGFWYSDGFVVVHVNEYGVEEFSVTMSAVSDVRGGHDCCLVYSINNETISYIDKSLQAVSKEYVAPDAWSTLETLPDLFSYDIDDYYDNANVAIPVSYDPIWSSSGPGAATWKEVQLNGEWLSKVRYHQVHVKLKTTQSNGSPSLDRIIMAPAVKLSDISSQEYKNLYIKTDVPVIADVTNYETKLRTWWSVIDV